MPHIHAQYDFTISAFIVHANRVLLVHHPKYNKWLPIGGHIELDEDPEMAFYREVREETGLDVTILGDKPDINAPGIKILPTPAYLDVHPANLPHQHIGLVYFAVADTDKSIKSDEHSDMTWLSKDELDSPAYGLDASIRFYASRALEAAARHGV